MPFSTPEKAKAYMKAYNQRPDVKAKRKQRRRQERLEIYRTARASTIYDPSLGDAPVAK